MKRILLLLFTALTITTTWAQVYNNEWIDYNKTYYKFKVGATKLYRIYQPLLASQGLESVNTDHFQLWRNGQQVPIYTSVQNGVLGASDFIEFWGEMNDGKPDNPLFRESDFQIADKWSLQTDTAAFFLTVNPAGNNMRLQPAVNDLVGNTLAPEPFFMHTNGLYYKNRIHSGRAEIVGDSYTYSSSYDWGEGYASSDIAANGTVLFNTSGLQVYTLGGAPDPVIKINAAGNAMNARNFNVALNTDTISVETMNYYDYKRAVIPISVSQISGSIANISITNRCTIAAVDRMVVAQIELTYPRRFHFGGTTNFSFELPASAVGNYLEIAGFGNGGVPPILYDLTNGKRYVGNISTPSMIKIALLPSSVNRKLVLVNYSASNIGTISFLEPRNFVNYSLAANQGDYMIITNSILTGADGGSDPVEEYRTYRSSAIGGSYNAKVYMIDQLIDQFAFGIKMHPLSIRNFLRWARANYSLQIKNVLLMGKAVAYTSFRSNEANVNMSKLCLVPTFGNPASDILLSAEGNSSIPLIPIGRIAVINKDEITVYLDKVKQYEQVPGVSSPLIADMEWRKNVVHVTGASDDVTTTVLQVALNGFKRIIEDTLYGAKVHTFTKATSESVQQLSSSQLTALFNKGIGMLTYFGHSSASTLEFNLENPQNYSNAGKYPIMVVMGCNAGNFYGFSTNRFLTKEAISEKYLLASQRGAVAFLASSHLGIVHYLDMYGTRAYQSMAFRNYGGTLGEIMTDAIKRVFAAQTENDFYARFQCEEFLLHGDPALKMHSFDKPDYVVEDQLVVTPASVSVAEPSFQVNASFMNIGRAPNSKIVVELKRTYPDLSVDIIRDTIRGTRNTDTLIYDLPIVATRDKGLTKITITVDVDNDVDEQYETNNSITKEIFIYEDEARPIFPYNYSIVNQQNIKLYMSSANPFAEVRDYRMEMDTTELFNSPFKVSRTTSSTGGIIEFSPGVTFADSTVYYWRVAPEPLTTDTVWNKSSFIYYDAYPKGFNQSHFYQQTKSDLNRLTIDSVTRDWKYKKVNKNIFVKLGSYVTSGADQPATLSVFVDGDFKTGFMSWFQSVVFNVFDSTKFSMMVNQTVVPGTGVPNGLGQGLYGSLAPQNTSQPNPLKYNFEYRYTDTSQRRKAMQFMRDVIPDGSYVVMRSFLLDPVSFPNATNYPQRFASDWQQDETVYGPGQSFYYYLKNVVGFTDIDSFNRPRNFALVYRKGDPNFTPRWIFTQGTYDNTTLSADCIATDSLGTITSPLLGPAKGWSEIRWKGHSADATEGDHATINVIGINQAGAETRLFSGIEITQPGFDISSIDAEQYPFIKVQMRNADSIHYTPYQLDYWRVIYDPAPEGGVTPGASLQFSDTVEVGEPVNFRMTFKNISDIDFDSLLVKLIVVDDDNVSHVLLNEKKKALLSGDTIEVSHTMETAGFSGKNQVSFEFNPDNNQPEKHHFNNYAFRSLYVKPDSLNPLLDVTFDGVHILNRDIVSSKPDILVTLKDEARWMVLDDTSLATVKLRYPDGSTRQFYFLGNDTLRFTPVGQAPNTNNTATINFNPYLLEDGEYELIVGGKDRSDNMAGRVEYRVAFQVINKPMISNMLNYPNPFTTSTAFVFTLTGSQVPQNIRIQVLTITGKIVREITKDELGPLRIGRNITEFKWDGTDQYGQKLANGIYLYRVITNLNGKSLDKYKSSGDNTDKYFNNGYGKMYLMR